MNADTAKLLTEFIGECWHKYRWTRMDSFHGFNTCQICGDEVWDHEKQTLNRRPFTGPEDAQVVKDKMVEKGLWDSFCRWAQENKYRGSLRFSEMDDWLHSYVTDPSGNRTGYRLLELAGEFLTKH